MANTPVMSYNGAAAQPPAGVTFDENSTQPIQQIQPAGGSPQPPAGVTFDDSSAQPISTTGQGTSQGTSQNPNEIQVNPNGGLGDMAKAVPAAFEGIGEGVFSHAGGIVDAMNKFSPDNMQIPASVSQTLHHLGGDDGMNNLTSQITGQPTHRGGVQSLGYGGETLSEFMMGDEALAGLPLSKRLASISKTLTTVEGSPRVMAALKAGASILKAVGEFSPEEAEFVKAHPVLARVVAAGHAAIRGGAVQGAQTFGESGGDVGQAAQDATITGVISGLTHGILGAVGGAATKAGQGGEAAERLTARAGNASTKEEVAQRIGARINQAKNNLHSDYEHGVQDLQEKLNGTSVSAQDNPLANKAEELLNHPDPTEHPTARLAGEVAGDKIDPKVRMLLEQIATGQAPPTEEAIADAAEKSKPSGLVGPNGKAIAGEPVEPEQQDLAPYGVKDLVDLRQRIRAAAEPYQYGDINSRVLRGLLNSVDPETGELTSAMDDTIEHLAEQSGNDEAVQEYRDLRTRYRNEINLYDEPVIAKLRDGKVDDAAKDFVGVARNGSALPSAGKIVFNTNTLRGIIGDQGVKQFGKQVLGTIMQDSIEHGAFNPSQFLNTINKVTKQTTGDLFDAGNAKSGFNELMTDAKSASLIQQLSRVGVLTLGGATGTALNAVPFGRELGLAAITGMVVREGGGVKAGRELLDYVANHPKLWATYRAAGRAAASEGAASAANLTTQGAGGAAAAVQGSSTADRTYQKLKGQLGGTTNPNPGKPLTALSDEPPADPAADSAASPTDSPVVAADKAITQVPQEVQNATSTIPVQVTQGQQMSDPNGRSSTATVSSNVDQGAGNNTIEINNPKSTTPAVMAHELTHVWQNNLPPSVQAKIPDDAKDMSAFDISDADKLRAQGKTLADLPREKQATIVQKYTEAKPGSATRKKLQPWVDDMQKQPLSSTMPTAPDATRLNMTPRAPGRPDPSVAGAYATSFNAAAKKKKS